jgi:hypothetical protein
LLFAFCVYAFLIFNQESLTPPDKRTPILDEKVPTKSKNDLVGTFSSSIGNPVLVDMVRIKPQSGFIIILVNKDWPAMSARKNRSLGGHCLNGKCFVEIN